MPQAPTGGDPRPGISRLRRQPESVWAGPQDLPPGRRQHPPAATGARQAGAAGKPQGQPQLQALADPSLPPVTTGGISDMFPLDRLELITLAQFEQVVRNNRIPSAKGLGYNAVGLAGEAGEFSNKVKRLIAEKGTP